MPSRKFSHRDSLVNRPSGGGNKKAGLAPFATNFMMGVKQKHNFDKQPVKTHNSPELNAYNAAAAAAAAAAALLVRAQVAEVAAVLAALNPAVLPADATEEQVAAAELLVRAQVSEVAAVLSAMGASSPATEEQVAAAEAAVAAASS